jgi:hypothetical protein
MVPPPVTKRIGDTAERRPAATAAGKAVRPREITNWVSVAPKRCYIHLRHRIKVTSSKAVEDLHALDGDRRLRKINPTSPPNR